MDTNEPATVAEISRLFQALAKGLRSRRFRMAVGSDGFAAPYIRILNTPERKRMAGVTPSNRTTIRIQAYDDYFPYLEKMYPRAVEQVNAAVLKGRPFLVIEGWIRYVELGKLLLAFARKHTLNVRCVDFSQRDSRLNAIRMYFDDEAQQWKVAPGAIEDLLRDQRARERSWSSKWNPRWIVERNAGRLRARGKARGSGSPAEADEAPSWGAPTSNQPS